MGISRLIRLWGWYLIIFRGNTCSPRSIDGIDPRVVEPSTGHCVVQPGCRLARSPWKSMIKFLPVILCVIIPTYSAGIHARLSTYTFNCSFPPLTFIAHKEDTISVIYDNI